MRSGKVGRKVEKRGRGGVKKRENQHAMRMGEVRRKRRLERFRVKRKVERSDLNLFLPNPSRYSRPNKHETQKGNSCQFIQT